MRRAVSKMSAIAMAIGLTFGAAAKAESLVWTITSDHPNVVDLVFYSQTYSRAWPGGGQVYSINDWNAHTFSLECSSGELICYGAWVRGNSDTYWGVGLNGGYSCSDCCAACGARATTPVRLTP